MTESDSVVSQVGQWVVKAENDLTNAAHTLKLGEDCPTDTVCFHAQQCVEKYLKALLVLQGRTFPKTHVIRVLVALLPARFRPDLDPAQQDQLTEYATVARYPGSYELIELSEARAAVRIARKVRSEIRKNLPRAATRRARK